MSVWYLLVYKRTDCNHRLYKLKKHECYFLIGAKRAGKLFVDGTLGGSCIYVIIGLGGARSSRCTKTWRTGGSGRAR